MSSTLSKPIVTAKFSPLLSDGAFLRTVNSVPETQGAGIVVIANGRARTIRVTPSDGMTVVIEARPSPLIPHAAPPMKPRSATSSPAEEWTELGFNCGGAILSWVGVAGTTALSPATGGASLLAAVPLWGGALASSGTCAVSVFRVGDMMYGNSTLNQELDRSNTYYLIMETTDLVGLVGAKGAFVELFKMKKALNAVNISSHELMTGGRFSWREQSILTQGFDLKSGKYATKPVIRAIAKKRLLDGMAGALAVTSSAIFGDIHDLVVWLVHPKHKR